MAESILWEVPGSEYAVSISSVRNLLLDAYRNNRQVSINSILDLMPLADVDGTKAIFANRQDIVFENGRVSNSGDATEGNLADRSVGRFTISLSQTVQASTLLDNTPMGEVLNFDIAAPACKLHLEDLPPELDDILGLGADFQLNLVSISNDRTIFLLTSEDNPQKSVKILVDANRSRPAAGPASLMALPLVARLGRKIRTIMLENALNEGDDDGWTGSRPDNDC